MGPEDWQDETDMTAGDVFSAIAAVAAVVAVFLARSAIHEARAGRRESADGHRELVKLQRDVTDYQLTAQRVAAAARVAEVLTAVAETAQLEQQRFGDGLPRPLGELRIMPTVLGRLRGALAALRTLGGPEIGSANTLAASGAGEAPGSVLGGAYQAMDELERLVSNHDAFQLDRPVE